LKVHSQEIQEHIKFSIGILPFSTQSFPLVSHIKGQTGTDSFEESCADDSNQTYRGGRKKLHYEELSDFYCSSNVIRVIRSRTLRWEGHVAHVKIINMNKIVVMKAEGLITWWET
jgi:hypothetical protein